MMALRLIARGPRMDPEDGSSLPFAKPRSEKIEQDSLGREKEEFEGQLVKAC